MSYYSKGFNADDEADDFDEYDPTPYGGGYDIHLTYGHPLPPSGDICHPPSNFDSDETFDYDRSQYTSYADSSAYADDGVLDTEYSSYTRPTTRTDYGSGGGYGRKSEYEEEAVPEYESEYKRNEYEQPDPDYGSGYGGRSERTEFEEPSYETQESEGYGGSRYGRSEEEEYGGRKNYGDDNYEEEDEEKKHHRRNYYDD